MIRVASPLSEDIERVVSESMDCGFAVHRDVGPGYAESIYLNALSVEFAARNIPFEREKPFVVCYRDHPVGTHRVDLVVRECVVIEVKAVKAVERVHEAQILSYLKSSGLPVGLLMNFGGATLKEGLRRFVVRGNLSKKYSDLESRE